MATWDDFATAAPDMAALGRALFARNESVVYLATVRADGSPQVHPVMVYLEGGRLWSFIVEYSSKCADLERDGTFALHSAPGGEAHEEFHLSGRATACHESETRERVIRSAAIEKADWEILFELAPERVLTTTWTGWGTAAIRPHFSRWSEARGYTPPG